MGDNSFDAIRALTDRLSVALNGILISFADLQRNQILPGNHGALIIEHFHPAGFRRQATISSPQGNVRRADPFRLAREGIHRHPSFATAEVYLYPMMLNKYAVIRVKQPSENLRRNP